MTLITNVLRLGGANILPPQGKLLFILIVPVTVFWGWKGTIFPLASIFTQWVKSLLNWI